MLLLYFLLLVKRVKYFININSRLLLLRSLRSARSLRLSICLYLIRSSTFPASAKGQNLTEKPNGKPLAPLEHKLFNISKYYKNLQVCYIALAFCLAGMATSCQRSQAPYFPSFRACKFHNNYLCLNSTHYISSFFLLRLKFMGIFATLKRAQGVYIWPS